MNISVAGTRRPLDGGAAQSSGDARKSSWQSQVSVNTTPAAAVTTTATTTHLRPESASDVMVIRQAGCWTRFWLFLGCVSTEKHH